MNIEKSIILISGYFKKDELIKSGSIVFIASLIAGLFSYIYQVYMGRALGPEDYGTFGALFSIFYIVGVISQTLGTSTTNFVARFIGEGRQIGFFIKESIKRFAIIGLIVSIIFFIFIEDIKSLFKITDSGPILVLIFILFLDWISPITGGILRGVKRFFAMSFIGVSNAFFKMIVGILLVTLGFSVSGALIGVAVGILISLIISAIFIKRYIKPDNLQESDFKFSSFYIYSLPVLIVMIGLSIPSNIDVILVKHFFSPFDAGIYSSIAVLGKIVLFVSGAVGTIMFPIIAEKHVRKEDGKGILKKSLLYTGILSGSIALIYIIFPGIIVKMFGAKYETAIDLVGLYGIGMFLFSLVTILVNYHLAMRNMRYVVIFAGFIILEIVAMTIFHSSILNIISILVIINLILVTTSMIYTFKDNMVYELRNNEIWRKLPEKV